MSGDNETMTYQEYLTMNVMKDLDRQLDEIPLSAQDERERLINQYMALRQARYEAVAYNVGVDMYTSSRSVCQYTGNDKAMNKYMWSGCEGIPEEVVPRDSVARCAPLLMDKKNQRRSFGFQRRCRFLRHHGINEYAYGL